MELNFSKYHGCGNDFICMDLRGSQCDYVALSQSLCQRGHNIGADGLLVLLESSVADCRMLVVNSDGSVPEMCGNGFRCFVAYITHQGFFEKKSLTIETDAGVLDASIISDDGALMQVSVNMGRALYGDALPLNDFQLADPSQLDIELNVKDQLFVATPVSMGNPHCVIVVPSVDAVDVLGIGPNIETHPFFPNRVNVEFVELVSSSHYKMRVWERGVGETNACGTGACAAVVAGLLAHNGVEVVTVSLRGGELLISVDPQSYYVHMQGPAQFVFSSRISI